MGQGKNKIRAQTKQVSEYCIKKALKQIDEDDYLKTLRKLAEKKWISIKKTETNKFSRMSKTTDYLLQKGYESELVRSMIVEMQS
jgi:regulatory protein